MSVICPYCRQEASLVKGKDLYPKRTDLADKLFWCCYPCGASVGCHEPGLGFGVGTTPLGRLANAELRKARMKAHAVFDPIWKNGGMDRHDAYKWLAANLGIKAKDCHIGEFNLATCASVIELCGRREESLHGAFD